MRAVVQRVKRAQVGVDDAIVGKIDTGLCVLLGVTHDDGLAQVAKIARKIAQQRILRNTEGADDPNLRVSAEESGLPFSSSHSSHCMPMCARAADRAGRMPLPARSPSLSWTRWPRNCVIPTGFTSKKDSSAR